MKRFKRGFTLAEVLITLAIIGVVAAISIPSVISNSQQQEFKTGLRKAVSVLNSAITMNMALDGESPYDNANLYGYLKKHMSTIDRGELRLPYYSMYETLTSYNAAFYTTDGMRFEFLYYVGPGYHKLHEGSGVSPCLNTHPEYSNVPSYCGGCGSYGLRHNPNGTTKPPCLILVDVNGDKKPTPGNVNCKDAVCASKDNVYKYPNPNSVRVNDIFPLLITDDRVIPYGVIAQKAMYQAQK